jgi:hypothetical protein
MKNYPPYYPIKIMGKKGDFESFGSADNVFNRRIYDTGTIIDKFLT